MIPFLQSYGRSGNTRSGRGLCRGLPVALVTLAMLLGGLFPTLCRCETDLSVEYQVKAAYLGKFLKYIDWKVPRHGEGHDELVIGIMGSPPMWEAAAPLAGKKVLSRTLKLRRIARLEDMQDCRLVFIGVSEKRRLEQIVDYAARHNLLTVSDIKRFVHAGGGIGFISRGKNVHFEINNKVALSAGATISSQVLRLADTVIE